MKNASASSTKNISISELNLPKGGGAITGLSAELTSQEHTGVANYAIPIYTSSSRELSPELSLHYQSTAGNGAFGVGFDVGISAVSVSSKKAIPTYTDKDTFVLDGQELVATDTRAEVLDNKQYTVITYRPSVDTSFNKIEQWLASDGSYWRVIDCQNTLSIYGLAKDSQITNPKITTKVYSWLLEQVIDAKGNACLYTYKAEDNKGVAKSSWEAGRSYANKYLQSISYGNTQPVVGLINQEVTWCFTVIFDYGEYDINSKNPGVKPVREWPCRLDSFSTYNAGFEIRCHRLCRNVIMVHNFSELAKDPVIVHVTSLAYTQTAALSTINKVTSIGYNYTETGYTTKQLPCLDFSYTPYTPTKQQFKTVSHTVSLEQAPYYQLVDLYGKGFPGILYSDGISILYAEPIGSAKDGSLRYASPSMPEEFPIDRGLTCYELLLMDMTGNGKLDLVTFEQGNAIGYYANNGQGSWQAFHQLLDYPSQLTDLKRNLVDLTGNGLNDLVILDELSSTVYPANLNGFAQPFVQLQDAANPIPTATNSLKEFWGFTDILGCGIPQVVRITQHQVECWPSLGYGKFGDRILLGTPELPMDAFDPTRVRLADTDGSGTLDLVYLLDNQVLLYQNCSGNYFAKPISIPLPASYQPTNNLDFADIYGQGSATLVFTNSATNEHWAYDFTGGIKPYLLSVVDNNMGHQSMLEYVSSASLCMQAQQEKPWLLTTAVAVHVVKSITQLDLVSGTKTTSTYYYRDGYYDASEREFCGFAYIECRDALELTDKAKAYDSPPFITKTWYQVGALLDAKQYQAIYTSNYYTNATFQQLPADVYSYMANTEKDLEEARLASIGSIVHQEISAPLQAPATKDQDASTPYLVSQHSYTIKQLKPATLYSKGIYTIHDRESMEYHYERNATKPLVTHELALKVNDYGAVTDSCTLAYGLQTSHYAAQNELKFFYNQYTYHALAEVVGYLPTLLTSTKDYSISGVALQLGQYLSFEQADNYVQQALKAQDQLKAVLLSKEQYNYLQNSNKLITPQALLVSSAITQHNEVIIKQQFNDVLSSDELTNKLSAAGYYLKDGYWWNPGLQQEYYGSEHFFLASAVVDVHQHKTSYSYDAYNLLLTKVTDALNNVVSITKVNYARLLPETIMDANHNYQGALYNELGMPLVTTNYGTIDDKAVGFASLDNYTMYPQPTMSELRADPQKYLQGAASYLVYELTSWQAKVPIHSIGIRAESFDAKTSTYEVGLVYTDGSARILQHKQLVTNKVGQAYSFSKTTANVVTSKERWLTTGRQVFNNKGLPIKVYEPYFTDTDAYLDNHQLDKIGYSDTTYYDALSRVIRVDTAKGFFTKTEINAWDITHFDENDTILDSDYYKANINNPKISPAEKAALEQAALFYNTPSTVVLDSLGQTIASVELRTDDVNKGVTDLVTRYTLDIYGNLLTSRDPRLAALAVNNYTMSYDMQGNTVINNSVDSGITWQLMDVYANNIYSHDNNGNTLEKSYDELHRHTSTTLVQTDTNLVTELIWYGDSLVDGKPVVVEPEKFNLRTQIWCSWDGAGKVVNSSYNLTGNLLTRQQLIRKAYKGEPNWAVNREEQLDSKVYASTMSYDAVLRLTSYLDEFNNLTSYQYYLGDWVSTLDVKHADGTFISYISAIDYNPHGQIISLTRGNGTTSTHTYEPTTDRLIKMVTTRESDKEQLQDICYTYDATGNLTHMIDNAWETVFHGNQKIIPEGSYTYNSIYELIHAKGREHPGVAGSTGDFAKNAYVNTASINDKGNLANYQQQYSYDNGANLNKIQHTGSNSWAYNLTVAAKSNRAVSAELTKDPNRVDDYFDSNGNQKQLTNIKSIAWNYRNNIASATTVAREDAADDVEYYTYDGQNQRTRKVHIQIVSQDSATKTVDTIYLPCGVIYRVMQDDKCIEERYEQRIALHDESIANRLVWQIGKPGKQAEPTQLRYQLTNYLHSSIMELDSSGSIISYEEYYPFGGTALLIGSSLAEVKLKRYRYSGKERDSVTGLYYYGDRYYAPWSCRWLSPDPAGTIDGLNLYAFVTNNPISFYDINGNVKGKGKKTKAKKRNYTQLKAAAEDVGKKVMQKIKKLGKKEKTKRFKKVKDIDKKLRAVKAKFGMDIQNDAKLTKAYLAATNGKTKDAARNFRKADDGKDEHVSTANMLALARGAGSVAGTTQQDQQLFQAEWAASSHFRMSTSMTSHHTPSSSVQHPTSAAARFNADHSGKNHTSTDMRRSDTTLTAGGKLVSQAMPLLQMATVASADTLNTFAAAPFAANNSVRSSISAADKLAANDEREGIKEMIAIVNPSLAPTNTKRVANTAKWDESGRKVNATTGVRPTSPRRKRK